MNLNTVNGSGFPLQIGLCSLIESKSEFGWRVFSSEHPWKNESNKNDGFIDIVLINKWGDIVIIVECKRVKDTAWTFLVQDGSNNRRHAKMWITEKHSGGVKKYGWYDRIFDPASPESAFCIVPGQDSKSRPMLERIAAEVIESTESFAIDDYSINRNEEGFGRVYLSFIVTTAELKLCKFNPADIDIKNGEFDGKSTKFETVDFVRFRKSLTTVVADLNTDPKLARKDKNINDMLKATERTVFVVNANSLVDLLANLQITAHSLESK